MLEVQTLLAVVSEDSPCGENLEYDPAYLQLERAVLGLPERSMGDSTLAAEPPRWREIQQSSLELLQRSKDLRITHHLLQSALALDGLNGLGEVLELNKELLTRHWGHVHPQLDADDDNDPTSRLNALAGLTADATLSLLRESPLVHSRSLGSITLRAALNAQGLQHFSNESLTAEQLAGALRDGEPAELEALAQALRKSHADTLAIEALIAAELGASQGIDLSALRQPLRQALQMLEQHAPSEPAEAEAQSTDTVLDAQNDAAPRRVASSVAGEVNNRDDVTKSLERILGYYARSEPSSPLPILLSRAKSLVNADFATIVRNLIPDGLSQFETLRGPETE